MCTEEMQENTAAWKRELRRIVARRKKEFSASELDEMSRRITEHILELDIYRDAGVVFAYMSMPGEVQTGWLIGRCLKDGKRVALPRIEGREMRFYGIDLSSFPPARPDESGKMGILIPGVWGIMEPDPERCPLMDDMEDALVIMPGVAFDRELNRAGYGGGYYDRYLAKHTAHPTLAAAYGFQIFDEVPHEECDVRPDCLLTESGIVGLSRRSDCDRSACRDTASDRP